MLYMIISKFHLKLNAIITHNDKYFTRTFVSRLMLQSSAKKTVVSKVDTVRMPKNNLL